MCSSDLDRQYGWLVLGLVGAAIMEGTAGTAFNFESKGNESFGLLKWGDKGYKAICNSSNNCLVDVSDKGYFTHYGLYLSGKVFDLPEEIKYEMTLDPAVFVEDSFKYVVLYQGVTDNKVKISFREFYEDRARPAFSQDIYYDLDPSGKAIIGFKGLRIAIEEATNFGVRYRVIEDYN